MMTPTTNTPKFPSRNILPTMYGVQFQVPGTFNFPVLTPKQILKAQAHGVALIGYFQDRADGGLKETAEAWGYHLVKLGHTNAQTTYRGHVINETWGLVPMMRNRATVEIPNDEFSSVEALVEYLLDNDRIEVTYTELSRLALRTKTRLGLVRTELESYGLTVGEEIKEMAA